LGIIQSAVQFAFAVIVNGGRYSQTFQILSDCNIIVPDEKLIAEAKAPFAKRSLNLFSNPVANGETMYRWIR
jgi:hypothetical protein